MWFLAVLFVGALVASLLLTPKPKFENARAQGLNDLQYPRAQEGAPVPLILGRVKMPGPNTTWVGDFEAVAIKKKQKTGLFSSKKVIVGYTYYIGLDLALALGQCTLHKIVNDKTTIWEGTASADENTLAINLPNLFGGKEKGGGLIGTMRYYRGSQTQGKNAYLASKIGAADTPAYRGFAHLVLEKMNIGESNQLRAMWMELSQYTNGLGLGGGMQMVGQDMNPMELLYQAFTLDWGGLDVSPDLLDLDSLRACAQTLYNEGNGMSVCISTPNAGKEIANEVLRQVDGLMYQNPVTGKMVMKLIRNDYVLEDLPIFDKSNIIVIRNFTSKLWEDTVNQVRVKYTDRSQDYKDGTAMVQDMANINAQGRIRSITNAYPGVMVNDLSVDLATRDLSQGSVPLLGASMELNREGAALRPGDPFIWSWDPYGIDMVVMRVKSFDLGALNDNRIVIEANQDEFAIDQTVFTAPGGPGSGVVVPNDPAVASPARLVREGAYFFAASAGVPLSPNQTVIIVSAVPPAGSETFDVWTSNDAGANYGTSEEGIVYTANASLVAAITSSAGFTTGILGTVVITDPSEEISSVTVDEILEGGGLFYIGQELFAHTSVVDNGDGTWNLINVRRALLDTVPTAHAINDKVWFIEGDNVIDDAMGGGDTVRVKVTPQTFRDQLDVASAPYDSVVLNYRAQRPLRPGNIKFDGGVSFTPPTDAVGSHTITWANRSRLAVAIRSMVDATNEYEPGQQTVIRHRVAAGAWTTTTYAPGVTTATINTAATVGQTVEWEIYSTRDGLDSYSRWTFAATVGGGGTNTGGGSSTETGGTAPPDTTPPYEAPPPATTQTLTSTEALAANDLVNIYNSSGAKVRKANATDGTKPAHGYVKAAVVSGDPAIVYFDGENDGVSGLTPGTYFLSTTGGQMVTAPPTGNGNIAQKVGVATASGSFVFEPGEPIGLVVAP
jgi:hypothetical protein